MPAKKYRTVNPNVVRNQRAYIARCHAASLRAVRKRKLARLMGPVDKATLRALAAHAARLGKGAKLP